MSDRSSLTDTSVVVAAWQHLTARLSPANSRTETQSHRLSTAFRASVVATIGTVLARWVRASALYRWFTAEPDPEVIVIDLRETYTVGPLLAVLDRITDALSSGWHTARTGSLTDTTRDAFRKHPIRTVALVALAALLTNLAVVLAVGTLDTTGLTVRLVGIALAALGTRIRVSWKQCTESVTYRSLVAALEPPESKPSDDSNR